TLGVGAGLMAFGSSAPADRPGAAAAPAREPPAPGGRKDLHGDPLPDGAVMRLGTVQRRAVGAKLAFSPDGKSIIGVREGKYVKVWDAASGRLRETRELPGEHWLQWELSPDGRRLVTAWPRDGELSVWDVGSGKLVRKLTFPGAHQVSPV